MITAKVIKLLTLKRNEHNTSYVKIQIAYDLKWREALFESLCDAGKHTYVGKCNNSGLIIFMTFWVHSLPAKHHINI